MQTNKNFGLWYYLITIVDAVSAVITLGTVLSFISICINGANIFMDKMGENIPPVAIEWSLVYFTPSVILFCIGVMFSILIPTKKDLLIIFGLVVGEDALLDTGTKLGKLINKEIDKLLEEGNNDT